MKPSGEPVSTNTVRLQAMVRFAATIFTGLFAGFLVTVSVLEASLRDFGAAAYTQVRLVELTHLDDLATALLIPALVGVATLTAMWAARPGRDRWLSLVVALLLVATLVVSVSISVPINAAQQGWSVTAPPADWSTVRDRWQLAHAVRTVTAVLAFLLLTAISTGPQARDSLPNSDRESAGRGGVTS
jgi:uncharacterized membrane protein